ncbi:hypothetical protein D3C71_1015010 [compost metagenome]
MSGHFVRGAAAPGAGHRDAMGSYPSLHLVHERMAVGLQGDAGQAHQGAQLRSRQLIEP